MPVAAHSSFRPVFADEALWEYAYHFLIYHDISLIGSIRGDLQPYLDAMLMVAAALGLRFNAAKCSSITISKGKANPADSLLIRGVEIRSMAAVEHE
jgi:hypothetical protein